MSNSIRFCLGLVLVMVLVTVPSGALGDPAPTMTTLEHLNAHAMVETLSSGYWMIQQEYGIDTSSSVGWSGTYSETGWTGGINGTLYGSSVRLDYTGTSTLEGNDDLSLVYQATGAIDVTQTITVNGTGLWTFDAPTGLYTTLYLEDQGLVDTPKLKWWAKALEAVGGGAIGFLGGGWGGVLDGAQAGIALSGAVFGSTIDNTDPPEPSAPALVAVSDWNALVDYDPASDEIISRIFGDGTLNGNVRSQVLLNGTWNGGVAGGTASTVPEPMTMSILAVGGAVAMLRRRRRNKA